MRIQVYYASDDQYSVPRATVRSVVIVEDSHGNVSDPKLLFVAHTYRGEGGGTSALVLRAVNHLNVSRRVLARLLGVAPLLRWKQFGGNMCNYRRRPGTNTLLLVSEDKTCSSLDAAKVSHSKDVTVLLQQRVRLQPHLDARYKSSPTLAINHYHRERERMWSTYL